MAALYFFLGIMVVSLIGITLVSALEKRLVWPYVPPSDVPPERCPPPNAYAYEAAAAAAAEQFTWLGTFADGKGKLYRLRYDFFRSPEGDVLAVVGTGTLASVPMQTTWLHTLLADGRCLVTVDHQNGGETDLAGLAEEALIANRGFTGQAAAHRARIAAADQPVTRFSDADPLASFRAYRQKRIERLAALGYAAFLDPQQAAWRYSLKGAVTLAFRQYFTALRRAVVPDKVRSIPGRSADATPNRPSETQTGPGSVPAPAVPAPKFVQTTALLVFLYSLLLLGNAVVFAFLTRHWVLLWVGFSQAVTGLWLMGSLSQLKRWAWWALTFGGILFGLRDVVGLLADLARLGRHLPSPHPQWVAVHVLGVLLVWPIVVRLLMKPSRLAFGLSKQVETQPEPMEARGEPASAGVWPPPPSPPAG